MNSNYILKESTLEEIKQYHESDNLIKKYFNQQFEFKNEQLQPVKIFIKNAPELKFRKQNWFENLLGSDITEFDFENSVKLFESLPLNPVQASDPRLWAYLTHGPYFEYVKNRYVPQKNKKIYQLEKFYEYNDSEQKTIKNYINSRFFTSTDNRSFGRNAIAFLWWATYLTCSPWDNFSDIKKKEDKYHYTKILFKSGFDLYQQIFERVLGKEPKIVFATLDFISKNNLTRSQYRNLIKKINSELAFRNLSFLNQESVEQEISKIYNF